MKNRILVLNVAMAFLTGVALADPGAKTAATELDRKIESAMTAWQVPGLAVVVVQDGRTVLMKGYGTRHYGRDMKIDDATILQIASNSKVFTAYSIGMLVDEGKLNWDDPVKKHIPEMSLPDEFVEERVSIDDLLSHRSGLTASVLGGFQNTEFRIDDLLAELEITPLASRFRARNHYSQVGMALLGEVVRRVSGMTWELFIRSRIFEPIGMSASYTSTIDFEKRVGSITEAENTMTPAAIANGQVANGSWESIGTAELYAPAGGVISNLSDMSAWIGFRLNGGVVDDSTLISPESVQEIRATRIPFDMNDFGLPSTYIHPEAAIIDVGFGQYSFEHRGHRIIIHNGGFMASVVAIVPEAGIGVGIFSNSWFDEPTSWSSLAFVNALALDVLDYHLKYDDEDWVGRMKAIVSARSIESGENISGLAKDH